MRLLDLLRTLSPDIEIEVYKRADYFKQDTFVSLISAILLVYHL